MKPNEIIIYKTNELSTKIEVKVENETVWLTQAQMVELFNSTKQNISLHINNIFEEGELEYNSTVKEYLTVRIEGKRKVNRKVLFYNLDVIISVGYRVKSKQGTQFRIWASKILKEYLLKGYVLNNRINKLEEKIIEHDKKFELILNTNLPKTEGIYYDGQIFDAWHFVTKLIKTANKSIILIDNYINEDVLLLLTKRNKKVKATIYTQKISKQLQLDIERHNSQYDTIEVKQFKKLHDRFLIIDNKELYHIGASLKDLGKKWFAFSKIKLNIDELIKKII